VEGGLLMGLGNSGPKHPLGYDLLKSSTREREGPGGEYDLPQLGQQLCVNSLTGLGVRAADLGKGRRIVSWVKFGGGEREAF